MRGYRAQRGTASTHGVDLRRLLRCRQHAPVMALRRSTPCVDALRLAPCTPQCGIGIVSTPAGARHALMPSVRTHGPRCARYPRMAWIYVDCYVFDRYADGCVNRRHADGYVADQYSRSPFVTPLQSPRGPIPPRGPAAAEGHRLPPPWARPAPPNGQPGVVPCAVERRNAISSSCSRCTPAWSARADRPRSGGRGSSILCPLG